MMELLAPAGNLNTALAAFDAGADAVYAGLQRFNARERGDNFTAQEMAQLVNFAHKNGKKVYVTFNTLVYQSELESAADELAQLSHIRPDALIVQDIGIVRMVRQFFPNLRIHGSTQMAIHNSAGIRTAAEMGIRRVILERQVTLDELRLLMKNSPLEVEVFVHGALCCSLSGICLLSSHLDGTSGNRGTCHQPCRRLFRDDSGREGFFLSTRDLSGLKLIPEFMKMGIASVKIEGRLRKADYVSTVVSAYRKVMDHPESERAFAEAAEILSRACQRERSLGFYTHESSEKLIQPETPGGAGKVLGRALHAERDFFEAELISPLHVGDNIRVQSAAGGDASAFTVLELSDSSGKPALKVPAGRKCRIGCRGKTVIPGGILYKIGETHDTMEKRLEKLPPFRPELPAAVEMTDRRFSISVQGKTLEIPLELSPAARHAFEESALENAFLTLGEMPVQFAPVSVKLSPGLFVPASLLKDLRRQVREWACIHLSPETDLRDCMLCAESVKAFLKKEKPVSVLPEPPEKNRVLVLPYFTPETDLPALKKKIESALRNGIRLFAASSLSHFVLLKSVPGISVLTAPPFPVCNSFAAAESGKLGAVLVHAHLELPQTERAALAAASPVAVGVLEETDPVLLATRAFVKAENGIMDAKNRRLRLVQNGEFTEVHPESPVHAEPVPGTIRLQY